VAEVVQTLARTYRKPLLASWMGGDDVASGAAILNQAGIPSFAYPDAAAHHFQTLWRYTQNLRSLYETPGLADDGVDAARRSRATQLIEACRTAGCEPLDAPATHKLLAAYNIPLRRRPPHAGLPLHLSSHPDPQFGPVLRFGVGGPLGSPLNDVAIGLPPLNTTLARRVMEQTRIYRTLHQHVNLDALAALLVRFSQLVAEQRWIESISLDPLLAQGDQIVAAEATVRLYGPDVRETDLPRLAIRPYPSHQVQPWALRDGTPIVMRPIRPEDEPLLVTFHQTVSEKSVYLRYFFPMKLSQRISHERLARISFVDYDRAVVLAAERSDATTGEKTILAVGRLNKLRDGSSGEFAVLVNDAWQGHGLGTELLRRLIAYGKEEGITRIIGHVLPDNRGMQAVARKLGFRLSTGSEGVITAELTL
jgi:acetyltransferase